MQAQAGDVVETVEILGGSVGDFEHCYAKNAAGKRLDLSPSGDLDSATCERLAGKQARIRTRKQTVSSENGDSIVTLLVELTPVP